MSITVEVGMSYLDYEGRLHGPIQNSREEHGKYQSAKPAFFDPAWKMHYWSDGSPYDPPNGNYLGFGLDRVKADVSAPVGEPTFTESLEPVKGVRKLRVSVWIGVGLLSADAEVSGEEAKLSDFILEVNAMRIPVASENMTRVAVSTPKGMKQAVDILCARALEEATA